MRILHTSDWHVGKRLGRYDRSEEFGAALDEVVGIADDERADLVVVSGDLFDRAQPPVEALRLAFDGLSRLAASERPVVVVAGNHDSPDYFEALSPFLARSGIHLVGRIKPPTAGGVLSLDTARGPVLVGCFPFLREGRVVDFMADTGRWYGAYADRVRALCEAYGSHLVEQAGVERVAVLVAHFMVTGARLGGSGERGERAIHIGEAYTATEEVIPRGLSYVAMGHIHAPQPVPGANVPAEYAGSLLPLDFGEAGEQKRVVMVDAEPGRAATVRSVPIRSGRPLIQASGTWDEVASRPELKTAYVDLAVTTDGPDPGLGDRATDAFPFLVRVRAVYERPRVDRAARGERSLSELYAEFHEHHHGTVPSEEVAAAFGLILEEASDATA